MNKEIYDDFSQDYDRFVNWQGRLALELPFIQKHLQVIEGRIHQKPSVLDAACGSGMHAIELAKIGYAACGSDLSPRMLEKARENAQKAGVKVKFLESAFGSLAHDFRAEPEFPFDLVLCLGNSLPHVLTLKEIQKSLWDMTNCLQPGGYVIFQNRNFDAVMEKRERWMEPQSRVEGPQEWVFVRFYDFDRDGLITFNILRLHRSGDNGWQQRVSTTRLYPLKQDTLVGLLEDSGFTEITSYGFMGDEPFDQAGSDNLVITARKK